MTGIALVIFGLYLVAVGHQGNAETALTFVGQQKEYIPWIAAILILWGLYQIKTIRPFIGALSSLVVVALVVKNFTAIEKAYQNLTAGAKSEQ